MHVKPVEIDDVLHNPWMGWGIWAGPVSGLGQRFTIEDSTAGFGDDAPLFDWICLDWMWADLEPREGEFHWDDLDYVIAYWADRGKQINLRVWVTDDTGWAGKSGADKVCPAWLWEAGAPYHEYADEGGHNTKEPDYAHPDYQTVYLPRMRAFIEAVAERYDKPVNPFNLIGCMGYGQWGEWHTLWSRYVWPDEKTKHDVLSQIVRIHADAFKHSRLSISYGVDTFNFGEVRYGRDREYLKALARDNLEDFKYRQALDVALANRFALARHGFIDGLIRTDKMLMEEQWRHTPMYAEGDWAYSDIRDKDTTHGTLDENIDVMLNWHSNYAHFYVRCDSHKTITPEDTAKFERGLTAGGLGHRLVLAEAEWPDTIAAGQQLQLRQVWENRNVGRLYHPHLLKLYLFDSQGKESFSAVDWAFDCTGWIRGEEYEVFSALCDTGRTKNTMETMVPDFIEPGEYELRIALVDIESLQPRIQLAIAGSDNQMRYKLGTIQIVK